MDFDKTVRTTFPQMREKNICSRSFLSELLMIGRTICVLRYSSKSFDFTRVFFKPKCAGLIRSEKPRQLRVLLSDGGINNVSEAFLNPVSEKTLKWKQQKYYVYLICWYFLLICERLHETVICRQIYKSTVCWHVVLWCRYDDVFSDSGARNSSQNDRTWRQH